MKSVVKKRFMFALTLFWFVPQVYVVMNCLQKGPCSYDYRFNITFLILWDLLPSLFKDFWVLLTFLLVALISIIIAFFISMLVIKKKNF